MACQQSFPGRSRGFFLLAFMMHKQQILQLTNAITNIDLEVGNIRKMVELKLENFDLRLERIERKIRELSREIDDEEFHDHGRTMFG